MVERLAIRPKQVVIPQGSEELRQTLYAEQDAGEYPTTTDCWRCDTKRIPLTDRPFSYPIGPYDLYFGRIPMYWCGTCDGKSFPSSVLDRIQKLADEEIGRLNPKPQFRNPAAVAFHRSHTQLPPTVPFDKILTP